MNNISFENFKKIFDSRKKCINLLLENSYIQKKGCDYEYTAKMLDYSTDSIMNIISKMKRETQKNKKMTNEC